MCALCPLYSAISKELSPTACTPSLRWVPAFPQVREAHPCRTSPELCKAHAVLDKYGFHFPTPCPYTSLSTTTLWLLPGKVFHLFSGKWPNGNLIKDAVFFTASHHRCLGTPPSHSMQDPRVRGLFLAVKGHSLQLCFRLNSFPSLAIPLQTLAVMSPSQLEVWLRKKTHQDSLQTGCHLQEMQARLPTLENVVSGVPKEFAGSIWESRVPLIEFCVAWTPEPWSSHLYNDPVLHNFYIFLLGRRAVKYKRQPGTQSCETVSPTHEELRQETCTFQMSLGCTVITILRTKISSLKLCVCMLINNTILRAKNSSLILCGCMLINNMYIYCK